MGKGKERSKVRAADGKSSRKKPIQTYLTCSRRNTANMAATSTRVTCLMIEKTVKMWERKQEKKDRKPANDRGI